MEVPTPYNRAQTLQVASRRRQACPQTSPRASRRLKTAPRTLQEAPILTSLGPLRTFKTAVLRMKSQCFEGALGTCQEHSARHPIYSKTSLVCQERTKIFQDKPLKASLLKRKPRSLQERIPRSARAGRRGWAAVPRRWRLG